MGTWNTALKAREIQVLPCVSVERRKRAFSRIANPHKWLFSPYYKHLVSMEGGYLAANIGNQGHSTPLYRPQ